MPLHDPVAAPSAPTGMREILATLAHARLSFVGFPAADADPISAMLGGIKSVARHLGVEEGPLGPDIEGSSAVILNLAPNVTRSAWVDAKLLFKMKPPLVAVGTLDLLASLPTIQYRAAEVLIRPLSFDELAFRLWRCVIRPNCAPPVLTPSAPRKPRILIADDDKAITTLTSGILAGQGFECHEARNGKEALDLARTLLPDLTILDVNMPIMNGFDVLTAIRADPSTTALKIMMFTAAGTEAQVVRGFGLRTDGYLCKPFRPFDFVRRVKEVFSEPAPGSAQ